MSLPQRGAKDRDSRTKQRNAKSRSPTRRVQEVREVKAAREALRAQIATGDAVLESLGAGEEGTKGRAAASRSPHKPREPSSRPPKQGNEGKKGRGQDTGPGDGSEEAESSMDFMAFMDKIGKDIMDGPSKGSNRNGNGSGRKPTDG